MLASDSLDANVPRFILLMEHAGVSIMAFFCAQVVWTVTVPVDKCAECGIEYDHESYASSRKYRKDRASVHHNHSRDNRAYEV